MNFGMLSQKIEFGGAGIPNLGDMNLCLLASWVKRYHLDTDKLWKRIVDHKYRNNSPNLFACPEIGASPFWKGVLWAARAAKMGYRWKIGNGRSVRFWEDHWFGSCSLAIQFWDLYVIVNEQNILIADVWDGRHLKLTFRRSVDQQLMNRWYELMSVAESIQFTGDEDAIIWKYECNGVYSVSSLYAIVNFRGITPVHIPTVWQIKVPPRLHVFLWLWVNNKILTRDNLAKRQHFDDLTCVFCAENESCEHLFFDCVVVKEVWRAVAPLTGCVLNPNLLDISSK
jgi:hypothetical protein